MTHYPKRYAYYYALERSDLDKWWVRTELTRKWIQALGILHEKVLPNEEIVRASEAYVNGLHALAYLRVQGWRLDDQKRNT
jgi:hypothetical protein